MERHSADAVDEDRARDRTDPRREGRPDAIDHDDGFAAMRDAYRSRGGLVRCDELMGRLEVESPREAVRLAQLLACGEVLGFERQHAFWVPMFQFGAGVAPRRGVRDVLRDLPPEFDPWRRAAWFVEPNAWLDGALPLDVIETDRGAVLDAARADRFVVGG
jgi:hypothetical protein